MMTPHGFPPASTTAYVVAWTTKRNGEGEWLDAGIYSAEVPTCALDGSGGYPFVIGYARSSRGYAAARAKVIINLQRCDFFDKLTRFPSFRRALV